MSRAAQLFEESRTISNTVGDKFGYSSACLGLGRVALSSGDKSLARTFITEAVRICYERGWMGIAAIGGLYLARQLVMTENRVIAIRLWSASAKASGDMHDLPPRPKAEYEQELIRSRDMVGADNWDREWEAGQSLSLDDAILRALEEVALLETESGQVAM